MISDAKTHEIKDYIIQKISQDMPGLCSSTNLNISQKVLQAALSRNRHGIVLQRKRKKLDLYKDILLDYFNEILPVKSGQKYRLQFVTDTELFFQIRWFLIDNHNILVSPSTIRRFVKKETRRSHVSKLDGCPYCFSLHSPGLSIEEQKLYQEHKYIAGQQQLFKRMILKGVADGSIPDAVVATMDFSKFDTSKKCESLECHIIVLRYGKSLANKVERETGVSKEINGLHRAYINIFAQSKNDKHDPDFVFLSWIKVIQQFRFLFENCRSLFVFTDGGPHHYKSKHGIFGFAHISRVLQPIMKTPISRFPQVSFHLIFVIVLLQLIKEQLKNILLGSQNGLVMVKTW